VNDEVALLFTVVLYALIVAIIVRSLFSWFPVSRDNEFARLLVTVTEPLLAPVRQFMPRGMMIDLSGMIVIGVLYVMVIVVQSAASR
jgi:YggT family protein